MSLEQTSEPRSKKIKLNDSDNATDDKTSLRQVHGLENALDNDQPKLVLKLAQKLIPTTSLSQKLSIRILKYAFEMRKEKEEIDGFLDVVRLLLSNKTVDLREEISLLHRVVAAGDTELATLLIQADARDTVENPEGGNMLWTTVKKGHHEIAAVLVRSGARLDLVASGDSHTILQEVLRSPKIDNKHKREELAVLMLEHKVDVNVHDDNGYSALDDAVRYPHCSFRLVEQLVEFGAKLRRCDSGKYLWAAIEKGDEDVIAKLVMSGTDLSVRRDDSDRDWDMTPLHAVMRSRKITNVKREQIVRLMLNSGGAVDTSFDMKDVLKYAIIHYMSDLIEEILSHGALPPFEDIRLATEYSRLRLLPKLVYEQRVPNGESRNERAVFALEHLIVYSYGAGQAADVTWSVKEILSHKLADSTLANLQGDRPCSLLNLALTSKKIDEIKLLLTYGADPHQKDDLGDTPLFQATELEDTEISRWLIEKGASIHACNDDGRTPIFGACFHRTVQNVQLLLDLGANINIVDSDDESPIDSLKLKKLNDTSRLVIKNFTLSVEKGTIFRVEDIESIRNHHSSLSYYEECMNEIEKMKATNVCSDVPYFSLFNRKTFKILRQMNNPSLITNFEQNSNNLSNLFPLYHKMLLHSFEIIKIRHKLFQQEYVYFQNAFEGFLPDLVLEKITHYSTLETVKPYEHNYYMSLHKTL